MQVQIIFANLSHLDGICHIWGANRATLGLMPKDAFIESIKKKWILVAVQGEEIAGYLLFRFTNRTQTVSIVHLCVEKQFRGKGVSKNLVDKLVEVNKPSSRGIKLSCRSDYKEAIAFWTRYNFQPRETLPSRGSDPSVHLIVWWFSFGKNDLFSSMQTAKVKAVLDFNIIAKLRDLNASDSCHDEIEHLIGDFLSMEVEYFQTSETKSEMFRDQNTARKEMTRTFLTKFHELNIDKSSINTLVGELQSIFPGMGENMLSDRRQVAESILSGFPFFVTLDSGILNKKADILQKYQLKIVKPSSLFLEVDLSNNPADYFPSKLSGKNFSIKKAESSELDAIVTLFLSTGNSEKKGEFERCLNQILGNRGTINVITESSEYVGLIGKYEEGSDLNVPILRTKQYHLRQTIFMQNIANLTNEALALGKKYLVIGDKYLTPVERSILLSYGFTTKHDKFVKAVLNKVLEASTLHAELQSLRNDVPSLLPQTEIDTTADDFPIAVYQIEKCLWPLKVMDVEIPCFIVPIKPSYARELFDFQAASLDLFGVQPKLIWSKENVYYRNVKPDVEKFPARILWYASSDPNSPRQQGIVGTSYLDEVVVGSAKELFKKYERFGVYSWEKHIKILAKNDPNRRIKVLRFSDSESFTRVIPLRKIKEVLKLSGESDNNFQAPLKVNSSTYIKLYTMAKQ